MALIAGALLLFPADWLVVLGLDGIAADHRPWIGLTFLVSACICLISLVIWIVERIKKLFRRRKIRLFVIEKLNKLTEDEKQILRFYFANGTRANTLRIDDGVVQELVTSRIIYRSAQMGNLVEGFAHNISDFAWDYIHRNPSVLAGTTDTYRTDKQDRYW